MPDYKPTSELQEKILRYEQLNHQWEERWNNFYETHGEELQQLDDLREKRNIALDEAIRAARDEADAVNQKSFSVGQFKVQKKETFWFIPEGFVATAKSLGIYRDLVEKGAIAEKIEIPYKEARAVLESMNIREKFLHCEDGKELTPAVSGPKNIPPLGVGYKER
jgi:hypothetical protein